MWLDALTGWAYFFPVGVLFLPERMLPFCSFLQSTSCTFISFLEFPQGFVPAGTCSGRGSRRPAPLRPIAEPPHIRHRGSETPGSSTCMGRWPGLTRCVPICSTDLPCCLFLQLCTQESSSQDFFVIHRNTNFLWGFLLGGCLHLPTESILFMAVQKVSRWGPYKRSFLVGFSFCAQPPSSIVCGVA